MAYEYAVVPAPRKGVKAKGVKSPEDRFAHALQEIMNEKGADGWEYVRTDTLPAEERQGLTGTKTVYQNMMVFRRTLTAAAPAAEAPRALLEAPTPEPEQETPSEEPTFTSRSDTRMMDLEPRTLEDDPARKEPKLRAD